MAKNTSRQRNEPAKDQSNVAGDEDVDTTEPARVQDTPTTFTPDPSNDENAKLVEGRRNEDLPLETPPS